MRLFSIVAVILLTGCATPDNKSKFHITGHTILPDQTVLYLGYLWPDDQHLNLDSAIVTDGKFSFSGTLSTNAIEANIYLKDEGYKYFWLENAEISFTDTTGRLYQAVVTGSKAQADQNELDSMLRTVEPFNQDQFYLPFIKSHSNSNVSVQLLSNYATSWGRDTTVALFNLFPEELKQTNHGKEISHFISLNKPSNIGDKFTDFSQSDQNGKIIRLSDFKGKVVLLQFWGSRCMRCGDYLSELVKVYKDNKDKNFEILGVAAVNDKYEWLAALDEYQLPWSNTSDLLGGKNEASIIYGVAYYPANFLIDKSGTIIGKNLEIEELKAKLKELL